MEMSIRKDYGRFGVEAAVLCLLPFVLCAHASGQTVKVDGTPTCFRALVQLSDEYAKTHDGLSFEIRYGGSFAAVEKLAKGDIEIAFIEFPLRKYVDSAWAKAFPEGKAPAAQQYTFAQTALGVVVNKKNALTRLTRQQLADIVSGKITSWPEAGGSGGRIKVLTSKALSGSMVSDLILDYRQWSKEVKNLSADTNVIASVMADADSIGFVALTPDLPKDVKLAAVPADVKSEAVQPTVENVVLERYSLVRQYKLILTDKSSPAARDFAQYACSQEASKIVQEWGLFPVYVRNKAEADKRLAEMKAGKGVRVSAIGIESGRAAFQDLAVEYVRSRAVIQASLAPVDADLAAVGLFVGGETGSRDLLLLGDKPSDRALQAHGQKWNDLQPAEYTVAGRAAAIIVNPANKLEALSLEQVRAIFGGEVDDWAIIGGTGLSPAARPSGAAGAKTIHIDAFGLRANDPAAGVFHKEGVAADKIKGVTIKKDTAEAIAAVSMDPQAIAFVDLSAIPASGQSAKVLGIRLPAGKDADGKPTSRVYMPTAENIKNAMYPLSSRIFMYVHPKASDTAKDFASFLATCGGSEVNPYADTVKAVMETYQKHGLISLGDAAIQRAAKDAAAEAVRAAKAKEAASKPARGK